MNSVPLVYTDGACRGNPGSGGWGALICFPDESRFELSGYEAQTTNNRMELTAAVEALNYLYNHNHLSVQIYTDSQYLKNGMLSWLANWKKNSWKTAAKKPVKNKDIWEKLDVLSQRVAVEWFWVKGHSGHEGNEYADLLANQAIDKSSV